MIMFIIGGFVGAAITLASIWILTLRAEKREREAEQRKKLHDLYNVHRLEAQTRRGFGRHS